MRSHVFVAEAFGKGEGYFFYEAARVDEDQRGAVVLGVGSELVEDLFPHRGVGDGAELVAGDFDGEVEVAALANLNDSCRLAGGVRSGEEAGYQFDGILRGGEADS